MNKYLKKINDYSWKHSCLKFSLFAVISISVALVAGTVINFPKNNLEKINWYKNFRNHAGITTTLLMTITFFSCKLSNQKVNNFIEEQKKEAYQELTSLLEENAFLEICENYSNTIYCSFYFKSKQHDKIQVTSLLLCFGKKVKIETYFLCDRSEEYIFKKIDKLKESNKQNSLIDRISGHQILNLSKNFIDIKQQLESIDRKVEQLKEEQKKFVGTESFAYLLDRYQKEIDRGKEIKEKLLDIGDRYELMIREILISRVALDEKLESFNFTEQEFKLNEQEQLYELERSNEDYLLETKVYLELLKEAELRSI